MSAVTPPPPRSAWRFSLGQLLLMMTVLGLLILPLRWIGLPALHAVIVILVFLVPFVWRPAWLYVWILPLVWVPTAVRNLEHHGDEYGGFLVGSLAGCWIMPVISALSLNSPKQIMPLIVLAGGLSMLGAGALLDRLRVPWIAWFGLWLAISLWMFADWFGKYPTVARALAKNGSYDTYLVTSINFGLTAATTLCIGGSIIYFFGRWLLERIQAE
ncbi:MAG: hypothetical protein AAGF97_08135 [Planctomycetota bacterium]